MTSTSFITGTGFMKCMPMTRSARPVNARDLVMEIDDVLLARMAVFGADASSIRKISSFSPGFSGTASTTRSASATPSARSVPVSDSAQDRFLVRVLQELLLDLSVEVLRDRGQGALEKRPGNVQQAYGLATLRRHVCDAVAHGAGPHDGDPIYVHRLLLIR